MARMMGVAVCGCGGMGGVVESEMVPYCIVCTLEEDNLAVVARNSAAGTVQVLDLSRDNQTRLGEGALAVIDNMIDQTTGTVKLKATFANADRALWPGQFVNARLLVDTRRDGVAVPAAVVQRGPQGTYAFLIKPDQTVQMRPITVDQVQDGVALIASGLSAGERVVVDGQYRLQPGSKVAPSEPGKSPAVSGGSPAGGPAPGASRSRSSSGRSRPRLCPTAC